MGKVDGAADISDASISCWAPNQAVEAGPK